MDFSEFKNEFLALHGFAKTLNIPPDTKYTGKLSEAENRAKESLRGLWKEC